MKREFECASMMAGDGDEVRVDLVAEDAVCAAHIDPGQDHGGHVRLRSRAPHAEEDPHCQPAWSQHTGTTKFI